MAEPRFVNHDCAFLLHGARLLLDGKQPFVDFVDMVPPLAFYAFVPVWWVSLSAKLPIELTWSLLCFALELASIVLAIRVVATEASLKLNDWLCLGPLFSGYLMFNLFSFYHLGQREHLFVIAFFPVFLIRWQRSQGNSVGRAIALCSGGALALCCFIKPQFLIVVAVLEIYWWLYALVGFQRQRYLLTSAPEAVAFAFTFAVLFLVSFSIPNINLYYTRWIPLVAEGYRALNASLPVLLMFAIPGGQLVGNRIVVFIAVLCALALSRRTSLIVPLMLFSLSSWLLYVIQGKGWAYHAVPLVAAYYMTVCVALSVFAIWIVERLCSKAALSASKLATVAFLVFGTLLMPTAGHLVHDSMTSASVFPTLDDVVTSQSKPADPVMILTTNFLTAYPLLLHLDRRQATRYMWSFSLPMLYYLDKAHPGGKWNIEINRFFVEIADDINKSKPKVIAIEASGLWPMTRLLLNNTATEKSLRVYEPLGLVNGFSVWRLKPAPAMDQDPGPAELPMMERGLN